MACSSASGFFTFPDITADGSITLGASVAAILLVAGVNPILATAAAFASGLVAGATTGILHAKFNIHKLLSGILVMTALYSVNLHVMGRSNIPLMSVTTLTTFAEQTGSYIFGAEGSFMLWGWEVGSRDASVLVMAFFLAVLIGLTMYAFFRTNLGTAMRGTGDNAQMIRALGVSDENMTVLGLSVSNGLIALSGALLSQYQGFADVQMGIGMVVWGLASVIIGEALVRTPSLGLTLTGAVMGSVLFRLMVAIALRWGLNPNNLKLITAVFVFAALILPELLGKIGKSRVRAANA